MLNLEVIIQQFKVEGTLTKSVPWGNGHINDTFKISMSGRSEKEYLLQRINQEVFKDVQSLMSNSIKVIGFVQKEEVYKNLLVPLIPTKAGTAYLPHEGEFWRLNPFLSDAVSISSPVSAEQSFQIGKILGDFTVALSGFPVHDLDITLPDFHHMEFRIQQFEEALKQGLESRIEVCKPEIGTITEWANFYVQMYKEASSGKFPIRVTHNDTKFDNILLNRSGKGGVVIDLDTLMPGYVFFDTGDTLRSLATSAAEDERDLSKITLNTEASNRFLEGFKESASEELTNEELKSLPSSGSYMAFMMAVRFLTDYFMGDVYYKTKYTDHNLVRARNQLRCVELLKEIRDFE